MILNFELFIAISTDARIKQEFHEEPAIKMQKTDHVAQRRISQHKNSPVAPQLAPPSSLPFPGQNSANVWQNPNRHTKSVFFFCINFTVYLNFVLFFSHSSSLTQPFFLTFVHKTYFYKVTQLNLIKFILFFRH